MCTARLPTVSGARVAVPIMLGWSVQALAQICSQTTKQKAIYATFTQSPTWQGATEVITDSIWEDVDGIYAQGRNGLFLAAPTYFMNRGISG